MAKAKSSKSDKAMDRRKGLKEGSKKDLKIDRKKGLKD